MDITNQELAELDSNGMGEGTVARYFYEEMRKSGQTHKESIRNWVDGLNNIQSESFSKDQLDMFKSILGKLKGKID